MSEHHIPVKHESSRSHEVHAKTKEHLAKVESSRAEKAAEHSNNHHEAERARHEVHENAKSAAEYTPTQNEQVHVDEFYSKDTKEHAFNTTMHHVRSKMKKSERVFSSFIHNPVVEKTSELAGKTIARPSGMMGATIAAFIGLLSVYSIAKYAGFRLSGSEMPFLLLIGFATGLFAEWIYKAGRSIIGKRSV